MESNVFAHIDTDSAELRFFDGQYMINTKDGVIEIWDTVQETLMQTRQRLKAVVYLSPGQSIIIKEK